MPKIARGVTGAKRVTSASANASPSAGVRSPERRRSSTDAPSENATTSSPRTSPARISSPTLNVASLMACGRYLCGGAKLGRAALARLARAGRALLDEARELGRALALGVVAHAAPDLDVSLRQGAAQRGDVAARDERVVLAPQRRDRAVELDLAVCEPARV